MTIRWSGWAPLAAVILLLLAPSPARAAAGPDLSIGFIGTLTGALANVAQDQLDGFKLGLKHLGGRIGGADYDLTVIDDRRDPVLARRALRQLVEQARVQVVLLSSSEGISATLAPLADAAHVFLIALDSAAPQLAGRGCLANVFSLAPLDETLNQAAGTYLQNRGLRSIVIAAPDTPHAKREVADFSKTFHGAVAVVTSRPGRMSFTEELARIREIDPDGVYLLHTGGMAVNFIIQHQRGGMKERFPLFGPAGTFDQTVIAAAGSAAVDLFSVAPWSDDLDTPSNRRLMADFEVEYGRPASIYAAYGYDAAMLLDRAVATTGRRFNDEGAMRDALRHTEFPATRDGLRFDVNHFPIETFLIREVVQDEVRGHLGNVQRGVLARDVRDGHAGECAMRWGADVRPR